MSRDSAIHERICNYHNIRPDFDISDNRCIHANPNEIPDQRGPFASTPIFLTDGNPFMDIYIASHSCLRVDGDTPRMSEVQTPSDLHLGENIQPQFSSYQGLYHPMIRKSLFPYLGFPEMVEEFQVNREKQSLDTQCIFPLLPCLSEIVVCK